MAKVSNEVRQRYEAKVYDKVLLRMRKDSDTSKDAVQSAATASGQSLQGYILQAVRERMEREKKGQNRDLKACNITPNVI